LPELLTEVTRVDLGVTPAATVALGGIPVMTPLASVMVRYEVKPFSYEPVEVGAWPPATPPPEIGAPGGQGLAQDSQPAGHVTTVAQSLVYVAAVGAAGAVTIAAGAVVVGAAWLTGWYCPSSVGAGAGAGAARVELVMRKREMRRDGMMAILVDECFGVVLT
jgi:hypothetical protein